MSCTRVGTRHDEYSSSLNTSDFKYESLMLVDYRPILSCAITTLIFLRSHFQISLAASVSSAPRIIRSDAYDISFPEFSS